MTNDIIADLKEALSASPDNLALRTLLAKNLLKVNRLDEAQVEYLELIGKSQNSELKLGLATVFFRKGNYSACNLLLEEVLASDRSNVEAMVLYCKALIKEDLLGKATEVYQEILEENPGFSDPEVEDKIKVKTSTEPIKKGLGHFVEEVNLNFNDVGGMDAIKREIDLKIIRPLQHRDLYEAYGKKIGGGILLYGPPGCGKTYIAKATAGQISAKFINISLHDVLDMWVGNSEKNLHQIFELARNNSPCVIFIDEIDALGADRNRMRHSASKSLINQFLVEMDGMERSNDGVLVIGATNIPWNMDPAFRRPGRFDRVIFVPPPDNVSKEAILRLKLRGKPTDNIDLSAIAKKAKDYSGADLDAIIDIAIEDVLEVSFDDGVPRPLQSRDLLRAIKKHKSSTTEWFSSARNFAMFANDSGLYNDVLSYLKIKQ